MKLRLAFLGIYILLCSVNSYSQEVPGNVLFVGNSYTYFWNLPQHVSLMAGSSKIEIKTRQSTAGGSNWGHHWRGERNLKTLDLLKNGSYDAIVLQNHSMRAIDAKDSLMYYGEIFSELINNPETRIYLYQTWSREWDPYMQDEITDAYDELALKINATVVPVGDAWAQARKLRPDLDLYDDDGSHPSPLGTYLTACVFYQVFTGRSPVGLPNRLVTQDADGEKLYINILSSENALFCQKVAEDVLTQRRNRN